MNLYFKNVYLIPSFLSVKNLALIFFRIESWNRNKQMDAENGYHKTPLMLSVQVSLNVSLKTDNSYTIYRKRDKCQKTIEINIYLQYLIKVCLESSRVSPLSNTDKECFNIINWGKCNLLLTININNNNIQRSHLSKRD